MSSAAERIPLQGQATGIRRPRAAVRKPRTRLLPTKQELLAPFRSVRWTLALACLLFYVVIITTYTFAGWGQWVIAVALIALLFEPTFRIPPVVAAFGVLVLLAYASSLSSPWPDIVHEKATDLGKVWLITLVAASTLRDRRRVRLFMVVFLAAYALYPVRGTLMNYFVGGYKLDGRALWNHIYSNPNDLAALTLLQLSITAAFFVGEARGWYKRAAFAGLFVLPLVIILTESRGVFLGLLVFGVLAGALHRKRARMLGFAAIVLVASTLVVPSSAWDRLGMLKVIGTGGTSSLGTLEDDGSAEQRYEIWRTAYRVIGDNAVQGVGWGAYPQANARYSPRLGARDTHSTFLNVTAELGFPGLVVFLVVIGVAISRAEKVRRRIRKLDPVAAQQIRLLVLGLIAYLVAGIFGSYNKLTFLYLQLVLIWAVSEVALARVLAHERHRRQALHQLHLAQGG